MNATEYHVRHSLRLGGVTPLGRSEVKTTTGSSARRVRDRFDEDGTIDDCDVDIDDDGIPNETDVCLLTPLGDRINEQGRSIGDLYVDCLATLSGFRFFSICTSITGPWQPPGCQDCIDVFDFDADSDVDLRGSAGFTTAIVAER